MDGEPASVPADPTAGYSGAGCGYPLGDGAFCGATLRPGSPYCARHHAICHVAAGSSAERRRLQEIEALAAAVGGRQGRAEGKPPAKLLRRLANIEEGFPRPKRSLFVRERT